MQHTLKPILFVAILLPCGLSLKAQDPHFTQFYSAPLTVNPAYTGVYTGKVRLMSNYRQQRISSTSPYNTVTLAMDYKTGKQNGDGQNPFNVGVMFMNDNSLNGAFKSTYATGTVSYHVPLDEDGLKSLGAGFSTTYGNRRINFTEISFSEQFVNGGFDLSLPSGEGALNNMKPFVSVGAGLLYQNNNTDDGTFFDVGVSGYHFNRPKQTVMSDPYQYLPVRLSIQASFQKYLSDDVVFNVKALYQRQAAVEYFLGGFSGEKLLGVNKEQMVGAGLWYRSKDAVTPYIRLGIKQFLLGLSYDVSISSLKQAPSRASSWELSFQYIIKNAKKNAGID